MMKRKTKKEKIDESKIYSNIWTRAAWKRHLKKSGW